MNEKNKNKNKKASGLGKLVRDWKEGMKLEDEQLIQFCLDHQIDPSSTFDQSEIQSLVSKALSFYSYKKEKKEQKEKKETQEIDDQPLEEQEEQEAHGGEEDEHQDIEDVQDQDNSSNSNQDQKDSENQQSNQSSPSDGSQSPNQGASETHNNSPNSNHQQSSNTQSTSDSSNSSETESRQSTQSSNQKLDNQAQDTQKITQIIQKNKKSNKKFEQFMKKYGEIEKTEVSLAQNTSRRIGYGGGGARMDDARDTDFSTFKYIQDFLVKLASDEAPMGKLEGKRKWDGNKIIKSRFNGDFNNAKFSRPKERNIWFIVDDSGSVSQFAEFIMSMIQGASNCVNVLHGSEGKPCNWVKLPRVNRPKILKLRDLDRFQVWEQGFKHSFMECLETFIKECKVQNGDILVFWGDLMDAIDPNMDTPELFRKTLRYYRCYWLLSHNNASQYRGNHTHIIEKSKIFKMIYNINNSISLKKAIQKIK